MKRIEDDKLNYWLRLWGLILLVFACFYLLAYWLFPALQHGLKLVFSALSPFLLGWLVAFLIEPAVGFLTRRCRFKRSVASLVMVLLAIILIAVVLTGLGMWIAMEIYHFSQNLPEVSQTVGDFLNKVSNLYDNLMASSWDTAAIQNWVESQGGKISQGVTGLIESAIGVLWSTPSALLSLLVTILAAFFISKDRDAITNALINKLFRKKAATAMRVYEYSVAALSGFIHAQVVLMVLVAVAGCIGLTILGVGSPIGMGILIAVVDVMPVLGPGLIMIPWTILSLVVGKFGTAIGLLVVYVVLTLIRQVLQPKLIADSLEVHPLLVLVGMVVGLAYMGVWGLILGPMIIVVIKSVLDARKKIG